VLIWRKALPAARAVVAALAVLLWSSLALAQEVDVDALVEEAVPQQERICDQEVDEVEAMLQEKIDSFGRMEQERLRTQLDEAQAYCDDGNEVMAAIRLEAVTAVIEVTGN
jgi:hypothetical protein